MLDAFLFGIFGFDKDKGVEDCNKCCIGARLGREVKGEGVLPLVLGGFYGQSVLDELDKGEWY
jgi:hypothetical protein